ncbi:MAG: hypothetical protein R2834_05595 [Rhodothermales bacterium]
MDVAFPALLIFLIVLPGIVCRYGYRKGSWTSPVYLTSISEEIAYGVVLAAALHGVWGWMLSLFGVAIDLDAVLFFLTGANGDEADRAMRAVTYAPERIFGYFLALNVFAGAVGFGLHEFVRRRRLDLRFRTMRFRNEWYYLFRQEDPIMEIIEARGWKWGGRELREWLKFYRSIQGYTYVSAVVEQGGIAYIYWGYLHKFYFDKAGALDRIVLTHAKRRRLEQDKPDPLVKSPDNDARFYPISGDYLVLRYAHIHTLNVEYRYVVPGQNASPTEK